MQNNLFQIFNNLGDVISRSQVQQLTNITPIETYLTSTSLPWLLQQPHIICKSPMISVRQTKSSCAQ